MSDMLDPFARLFNDRAEAMTDAKNFIYAAPKSWQFDLEEVDRTIVLTGTSDDEDLGDGDERVLRISWFPNRDGLYERWIMVDLYRDLIRRMGQWRVSNRIGYFELFDMTTQELIETLQFFPAKGQRVLDPDDDDE